MHRFFNNHYKGIYAEYIVQIILLFKGYKIIEKRFKTKLGEIDLICIKKQKIIFIEVKYRKNRQQFFDLIKQKQQSRIINASKLWLQKRRYYDYTLRYDVFFINLPCYFQHIQNAFGE